MSTRTLPDLIARLLRQSELLAQSEKLAAIGEMPAGVAHELNNSWARRPCCKRAAKGSPQETRAEKIVEAAERCARIVRNFRALARRYPPERRKVDLDQLPTETLELLSYQLKVDGVEVELDRDPGLPSLWADPHQLQQVVVNLLTNAQQAMRGHPRPRRLTVATRAEGTEQVRVDVSDTGPGIPAESRARLFEPFFTTKGPGKGTGLGLSLCKGIVEGHGGSIRLDSQAGRGTSFRIVLPLGEPPAETLEPAVEATSPPVGDRGILVVDDEPALAAVLAEMLEEDGHRVETACNGVEALRKLGEGPFDLVLSDIKMPELDGPGLYREVARLYPALRQRFIFLTGDTLTTDTARFLGETGAPSISKPFTLGEVQVAVHRALGDLESAAPAVTPGG